MDELDITKHELMHAKENERRLLISRKQAAKKYAKKLKKLEHELEEALANVQHEHSKFVLMREQRNTAWHEIYFNNK